MENSVGKQLIEAVTEVAAGEESDKLVALNPFDLFCLKFRDRIKMWMDFYQGNKFKQLPIVFIDNQYIWLNRAARRSK